MPRPISKISIVPLDRTKPHHKAKIHFIGLPSDLKIRFKAAAALKKETMRDAFIKFMRQYAKDTL